jgi:hypothetical protein
MGDTEKIQRNEAATDCEKKREAAHGHDSSTLAWLAETADGTREKQFVLVYRNNQELKLLEPADVNAKTDVRICDIQTPNCRPDRTKVAEVHVYVEKNPKPIIIKVQDGTDAIFLTESAVEKFLYPYYRAHRIWNTKMDDLQKKYETTRTAVGMLHRAPSNSDTFSPEGTLKIAAPSKDGSLQWLELNEFL